MPRCMLNLLFLVLNLPLLVLALPAALRAAEVHATLSIGAKAPDFCLPGIDGKSHCLKDYASSKVLVIVFTCDHCPTAQLYENRLIRLTRDYQDHGVAIVAIEPNDPQSVTLDEMGYTDVGDSFAEMKIRAAYRHFNFPYLYDGATQSVTQAYGPTATPHVFVFDSERRLRYEGRVDDNPREDKVTEPDARNAIQALLAGKPVPVAKTPAFGCSTKWADNGEGRKREMTKIEQEPVTVKLVSAEHLKALRKNPGGKLLLVDFWATWCGPCTQEFPEYQKMFRNYRLRPFDLVTVSVNDPDTKVGVMRVLNREHASSTNLLFGSTDVYKLMAAFDPQWNAAVPYVMLIRPDGQVAYQHQGEIDPLEIRRGILANLPDDDYIGIQAHWQAR